MIYNNASNQVTETHTIQEFIISGGNNKDWLGYYDLSYIERRENIEYIIKNIIDDYYNELDDLAKTIKFADWAVKKYRYNPKLLSYDLYKTTRLWHMILRLNGLANVHEFSLSNNKIRLLESADMRNFMGKIYSAEASSLQTFYNKHQNDETPHFIERYRPLIDHSSKFLYL